MEQSPTRPYTQSNQFASPETMSSPHLSTSMKLTAPSLISKSTQSNTVPVVVVVASILHATFFHPLLIYSLAENFWLKFSPRMGNAWVVLQSFFFFVTGGSTGKTSIPYGKISRKYRANFAHIFLGNWFKYLLH